MPAVRTVCTISECGYNSASGRSTHYRAGIIAVVNMGRTYLRIPLCRTVDFANNNAIPRIGSTYNTTWCRRTGYRTRIHALTDDCTALTGANTTSYFTTYCRCILAPCDRRNCIPVTVGNTTCDSADIALSLNVSQISTVDDLSFIWKISDKTTSSCVGTVAFWTDCTVINTVFDCSAA